MWVCPANRIKPPFYELPTNTDPVWGEIRGSYAYNAYGTDPFQHVHFDQQLGLGPFYFAGSTAPNNSVVVAESAIRSPSEMLAISDEASGGIVVFPNGFPGFKANAARSVFNTYHWHLTGANSAFCDGHVEFLKDAQLYGSTPLARARWNSDHEPHPETWEP